MWDRTEEGREWITSQQVKQLVSEWVLCSSVPLLLPPKSMLSSLLLSAGSLSPLFFLLYSFFFQGLANTGIFRRLVNKLKRKNIYYVNYRRGKKNPEQLNFSFPIKTFLKAMTVVKLCLFLSLVSCDPHQTLLGDMCFFGIIFTRPCINLSQMLPKCNQSCYKFSILISISH